MADADVQITAGSGTKVDTRTVGAGSDEHRQVVVVGDPTTAADVAYVDSTTQALAVLPLDDAGNARGSTSVNDGISGQQGWGSMPFVFNGTTWDRMRGDTAGLFAQGAVAHDAADSGNPVKIGGKAYTDGATALVAEGDRVEAAFSLSGEQLVAATYTANGSDGLVNEISIPISAGGNLRSLSVFPSVFNGTSWDRLRGNTSGLFAQGNVAHDGVDAGNPVKIGGKAASSFAPTAVAADNRVDALYDVYGRTLSTFIVNGSATPSDGGSNTAMYSAIATFGQAGSNSLRVGAVNLIYNGSTWDRVRTASTDSLGGTGLQGAGSMIFNGAAWDRLRSIGGLPASDANTGIQAVADIPHKVGYAFTNKVAQYTTAQTGVALWTPAAGTRIVVTGIQIQAGGTTAASIQVWFGASGDTTYTRGTDIAVFDGEFAPSSTSKPGVVMGYANGVIAMGAADHVVRVTTSAGMTVTVNVLGYEV
jgi:hypothetical protein